ncbi:multicopper oxidase family protein [Halococcoides cellulosivorans]|uniref:multicopper oxidase family protein n=1 Tax=Halococcoides cellulosivorans TaxID=1679096 RepID=UPI001F42217F|nr:multicopper oxidase family protein [Halococcoides cellulosivorans]
MDESVALTAGPGTSDRVSKSTWLYDDAFPGPELRAAEGDVVGVSVSNDLPAPTTVHWHGLPVANAMDGVPDVTQAPIASGDSFEYQFRADPPGTYFYHSHVGLQLDRGLAGPLVVEEDDAHVDYDADQVLVVDDYLDSAPQPAGAGGDGGPMGGMGGMDDDYRPSYERLVMNGRPADDPPTIDVDRGDRVRLRFVNASSATIVRVRVAGHPLEISHADGRPVEPVTVDSFTFGPGERYDAIVTADSPGAWAIEADSIEGPEPGARAVLQHADSDATPERSTTDGRALQYDDLRAVGSLSGIDGSPDREFDLTLSAAGPNAWAIGGQVYPDADPLRIREGEHVRIRMRNQSPVPHPMHLHGHFFRVGDAIKDTVVVPGHMGQETIDFHADNPGEWFFHCHNLYHLEAGMARVVSYV